MRAWFACAFLFVVAAFEIVLDAPHDLMLATVAAFIRAAHDASYWLPDLDYCSICYHGRGGRFRIYEAIPDPLASRRLFSDHDPA